MKVIAQQSEHIFLVDLGNQTGCIVNTAAQKAWPPRSLDSCTKGGYWVPVELSPPIEKQILWLVGQAQDAITM